MNKFRYYFILIITTLSLFSCSKDDNAIEQVPLRDYGEQFTADNITIEEYLNTYTFEVINAPGETRDQDINFTKIPAGGTARSIMSYLDSTTFPKLLSKEVELHDIKYKLYYLVLREGVGESPCNVDGVLTSYRGQYLSKNTVDEVTTLTPTQFEEIKYPQSFFNLYEVVTGWSEVFPEFKTGGIPTEVGDGTVINNDFGAGVMFLPSGLGYYAGNGRIPAYTPLIFSFKLYAINRLDFDNDGILSYLEDINGDGNVYNDDTDGDGKPDFNDPDDDGDGFLTRREITVNGKLIPFDLIPDCSGNTTDPDRKKKYLDKNCH